MDNRLKMTDRAEWETLPDAFRKALRRYDCAARARLRRFDRGGAVTAPLFHYTNRDGLKGIIENEVFWFTDYRHLNDDREITFGIEAAKRVLVEIGEYAPREKDFCKIVIDLISKENLSIVSDFYIGSFSQSRDDDNQWSKYAACGEGFAIGLAPSLFGVEPLRSAMKPNEIAFRSSVSYGDEAGQVRHKRAIKTAGCIVSEMSKHKDATTLDASQSGIFLRELANRLIATELVLNFLSMKGQDWEREKEVRLVILGEPQVLKPHVCTRNRGIEQVPYVKYPLPLRKSGSISEILIGPAAPTDAEEFACSLLAQFCRDPRSIVRRSALRMTELTSTAQSGMVVDEDQQAARKSAIRP